MPFKSDAQRRYLWSQKPEVAKQIAYKQGGGFLDYGQSLGYEREQLIPYEQEFRREGISPQDFIQDVVQEGDDLFPTKKKKVVPPQVQAIQQMQRYEPPKPESRWSADWNIPIGHALGADWNTYGSYQDMSEGSDPWSAGIKGTWRFNEGGDVPMPDDRKPSKVTKKDRYGNQVTVEYEPEVKPIDQTAIIKEMMNNMGDIPEMDMQIPMMDHPGEPKGTDTVPAWLTPGEFVVNKEATEIYGDEIKKMNDHGREIQKANKGMEVPGHYNQGGWVTDALLDRLAEVESGGNNKAVSPAGAIGKYQWLPSSAKQAGYGVKAFDPLDEVAARAATKQYLQNMQKHHGFTPEETLRAYNWGPGNVLNYNKGKRKDIPAEALNYPGKILGFDKVEGVPVHGEMPLPTPRPGMDIPTPTPRPQEEESFLSSLWNMVKGPRYEYDGGQIPHFDTLAANYEAPSGHKIYPEIKTGGHQMFGGNQNLAGEPVVQGPPVKEDPWYAPLLGHKSKEALGLHLDPNEARLYHEANPSLVGNDPAVGPLDEDIEGTGDVKKEAITNVPGESLVGQVDDFGNPKKETDAEIVGSADSDSALKDETQKEVLKKIDETVKNDANATGPGGDQKGPNATEKDLTDAAEKDPTLIEKAGGFLKGAFGDLFDGKELARAAIIYAGSRAMGYSHAGSMQYIAKNYLTRVDAKAQAKIDAAATKDKRAFELAKTDKFTPGSVAAYKKSGNPADLVSKKAVAGAIPTGVTEQRLVNGKKVSVQQVKMPDGSIGYNIPGKGNITKAQLENATKPYDPSFDKGTSEYRTRRSRAVKDNTALFKEIQLREGRYKEGDEYKYRTGIIPSQAAHDFWTFSESYGIDPESDEAKDLMGAAYRQAIAQSGIKGAPVAKNLKPFLEAAYIRQQTGAPELFQVNPDKDAKETEKFVRSDKMQQLTSVLDSIGSRVLPKSTKTDARNQIINSLVSDWGNLPEKEKTQWKRKANKGIETGFYLYAKDKADKYLIDNKLGE